MLNPCLADENRPICNRCKRCGFECTGPRDLSLVVATIVKSRRTTRPTSNQQPANSEPHARSNTNEEHTEESLTRMVHQAMSPCASLPPNKFDIYMSYTSRKYLVRDGPLDLAIRETPLTDLVEATNNKANTKGQFFAQAILCFATLVFGAQHRQTPILNQGYIIRGMALKHLNQALSEPRCHMRDDIFQCVAMLAVLEALVPTSPKSYLQHMLGLERLLELRNPSEQYSAKTHSLYKHMRHMLIFSSLLTGRPSVLAKPEWKVVMRSVCSESEKPTQDLFDVLADVTVLNVERNNLLKHWDLNSEKSLQKRNDTLERARALLDQLQEWNKRWETDNANTRVETSTPIDKLESLHGSLGGGTRPFTTVFEFSNDFSAGMLMFYNTTLIYVLQVLSSLSSFPLSSHPSTSSDFQGYIPDLGQGSSKEDPRNRDHEANFQAMERAAALEVCRCVPHLLLSGTEARQRAKTSNPIIHWAVTTAMRTLKGLQSAEGRWLMGLLNRNNPVLVAPALWTR